MSSVAVRLFVSSAAGANGDGYGTVLAFDPEGTEWAVFSEDRRIRDPRGLCTHPSGDLLYVNSGTDRIVALDRDGRVVRDSGPIEGLDPGGGVFGPGDRYYVGSRRLRTIMALPERLDGPARPLLAPATVPFPRGFAFGSDGLIFLASGKGPDGRGDETIKVFSPDGEIIAPALVEDPELSPLDMTIGPDGTLVVSSEWPFGASEAVSSVREYDPSSGLLVRTFDAGPSYPFRNPRGLRFGPDGNLYCVARDGVVSFDYRTGALLGMTVRFTSLFGQAVEFFG
jgi:sugar lactone lactonase YvrE